MHLRYPTSQVAVIHLNQGHTGGPRLGLQLLQVCRIQLDGALGQAFFDAHMLQVTLDQRMRVNCRISQWHR